MSDLRFLKDVSFDADSDLKLIREILSGKVKVFPEPLQTQDESIRVYVLSPNGNPLIIFDMVSYFDFIGMWSQTVRHDAEWQSFPCLDLAAFCGTACFAFGRVTVKNLIFLCLNLADCSVIDPCDPDGRLHDSMMAALEKHQPKPGGSDQP